MHAAGRFDAVGLLVGTIGFTLPVEESDDRSRPGPNETFAMPALRWMFGQLGQLDAAVVGSGTGLEGPVRVHAFADRRPRPHHASQPLALVVSRRP